MTTAPKVSNLHSQNTAQGPPTQLKERLQQAFTNYKADEDALLDINSDLYRILYELIKLVITGQVLVHDSVKMLQDTKMPNQSRLSLLFLDILWAVSQESDLVEYHQDRHASRRWQVLCRLVQSLSESGIVSDLYLKSSLENDILHHANLVPDQQTQHKKMLRINTKTFYTQMKYNLLREQSEGFAKLLCILYSNVHLEQLEIVRTDIYSLIGYFDLDANRVLDLIMDAYERNLDNAAYAELLRTFKRQSILHILGFKFQFYKREWNDETVTPKSLYLLAATLIRHGLLCVNDIAVHLSPSKDVVLQASIKKQRKLEERAKSFGKISLVSKSIAVKDKSEENDTEIKVVEEIEQHNQLIGLLVSLFDMGLLEEALPIMDWFIERNVKLMMFAPVREGVCKALHLKLTNIYATYSIQPLGLASDSSDADRVLCTDKDRLLLEEAFLTDATPLIRVLGEQLHCDKLLFNKIIRIMRGLMDNAVTELHDDILTNPIIEKLKDILIDCILPALSCVPCDPSLVFQIWDIIKSFPFNVRYQIYQYWEYHYTSIPELQLVAAQVVQETRRIMRRLTADQARQSSRSMTHIAHSNPIIVFRTILRQVQSYDNLIQPAIEALKFVTPIGMDVLSFVLVSELSKSRQSMKADGTNVSLWLASLASFSGCFYRKYPNVELGGLLQYIIQRLQNWESVDLIVLSELLSKMGSCGSNEDISETQLEAQAGGPHLWSEPPDAKLMNRRALPRLRDALVKRNLALPLFILICQMRGRIEYHEECPDGHLKLLGRLYDTCQMTLIQLVQFLNTTVDVDAYQRMLPSLSVLVREYNVPPELAMIICRPGFRCDDPILCKAPRSIYTCTSSSTAATESRLNAEAITWYMHSPEMLADVSKLFGYTDGVEELSGMTGHLYTLFWNLTLYDLHIPFQQYEAEINRLRSSMSAANNMSNSNTNGGSSVANGTERKKLKEKSSQMIDRLTNEQKDQVAHRKRVLDRLEHCKNTFFHAEKTNSQEAISQLVQKCIIPRALQSPEDALYCAKFMERLHFIDTPQFLSLQYYNLINLKLPSVVFCITEREAGNFGIFLKETLTLLNRWFQSKTTYEEPVNGRVGLGVDLLDSNACLSHRQYRQIYARWHRCKEQVLSKALASKEYMQIRNTLIMLTKIIDVFPLSRGTAENILILLDVLTDEDREDIKIMARRYHALLAKRKSSLMEYPSIALPALVKTKQVKQDSSLDSLASRSVEEKEKKVESKSRESSNGKKLTSQSKNELETGEIPIQIDRSVLGDPSKLNRISLKTSANEVTGNIQNGSGSINDRKRPAFPQTERIPRDASTAQVESKSLSDQKFDHVLVRKRDRSSEVHRTHSRSPIKRSLPRDKDPRDLVSLDAKDKSRNSNKRPKTDATEAELRRQLTEMKQLEQKRDNEHNTDPAESNDKKVTEGMSGRKIVSLVSGKRDRDTRTRNDVVGTHASAIATLSTSSEIDEISKRRNGSASMKPLNQSPNRQESIDRLSRSIEGKKKRFVVAKPGQNSGFVNTNVHIRDDGRNRYDQRGGTENYRSTGNRKMDRMDSNERNTYGNNVRRRDNDRRGTGRR